MGSTGVSCCEASLERRGLAEDEALPRCGRVETEPRGGDGGGLFPADEGAEGVEGRGLLDEPVTLPNPMAGVFFRCILQH